MGSTVPTSCFDAQTSRQSSADLAFYPERCFGVYALAVVTEKSFSDGFANLLVGNVWEQLNHLPRARAPTCNAFSRSFSVRVQVVSQTAKIGVKQ